MIGDFMTKPLQGKKFLKFREKPQPKLLVRLTISKVERKLIVVSILYILVVRSCSILKWDLWNPSNTFVLYWIEIR